MSQIAFVTETASVTRILEHIGEATKDDRAEAACMLALNLAQCRAKYGELPAGEYLSLGTAASSGLRGVPGALMAG